jgi:glucose-6-phosphate 1-epimerase
MDIVSLDKKYGIKQDLEFTAGNGGLPTALISNEFARASVSIYGAHVLSYRPKGRGELLWLSGLSAFEEGKAIRGGIPVCFPWFGPHSSDAQKPQHGFARLRFWEVGGTKTLPGGETQLHLLLHDDPKTKALWNFSFMAEMIITVGTFLNVEFRCTNTGTERFTYTDALHSYFSISDLAQVNVNGLAGCRYYDGFGRVPLVQKEEKLVIDKEENRRYIETIAECILEDGGFSRKIRIRKTGSRVTVVWNPGEESARKISDMPDDGYRTMLCIEAANAYDDTIVLQPKETGILSTNISIVEEN